VLVVDAVSLELEIVVEVVTDFVGQSGQIGWPVIWTVVVDCPLWPRTLGRVPIAAVCTEKRVRVTSRRLTKVRFVCNLDFQVMFFQALQSIRLAHQCTNYITSVYLEYLLDILMFQVAWRNGKRTRMVRLRDHGGMI